MNPLQSELLKLALWAIYSVDKVVKPEHDNDHFADIGTFDLYTRAVRNLLIDYHAAKEEVANG